MPRRKLPDRQRLARAVERAREEYATTDPRCSHFGHCGGCSLQDLSAEQQLATKVEAFRRLRMKLKVGWLFQEGEKDAVPSPQAFGYRQRMDFVCSQGKSGLRGSSARDVIELSECHLAGTASWRAFTRARDVSRELDVPDYDYSDQHQGCLRYIVVRQNREQHVLVVLVSANDEYDEAFEKIAETLIEEGVAQSVHLVRNARRNDTSTGEAVRHWGSPIIAERLLDLEFAIGPDTFFQANPAVAELAYGRIRDWLRPMDAQLGWDLYSGTGTIAGVLAPVCKQVIAVENNSDNQLAAAANLQHNGITNVDWQLADVEKWLKDKRQAPDILVLNPPRAGVGDKSLAPIIATEAKRIAYLSCNPLSLIRDMRGMIHHYRPVRTTLYDMFPQTPHWETLVEFEKRDQPSYRDS